MTERIESGQLVAGRRYRIEVNDCCVKAELVGVFEERLTEEGGEDYPELRFDIGLFTESAGCAFYEVET
jgi:hypothetical protein